MKKLVGYFIWEQGEENITSLFQVKIKENMKIAPIISDGSGLPEPENPTRTRAIFPYPKRPEPELFTISQAWNYPNPNFSRFQKPEATRTRNQNPTLWPNAKKRPILHYLTNFKHYQKYFPDTFIDLAIH